jgi:hypothetical protein
VCSDGDLLEYESEYVTLDYAYRTLERARRQDSNDTSSSADSSHRHDITPASRGGQSSNTVAYPQSLSPSSFSSTSSTLATGNFKRYYNDDSNYFHHGNGYNSSGGSSGYGSNGSSGWTNPRRTANAGGSLQCSGTLPAGTGHAIMQQRRSTSADRLWGSPPGDGVTSPTSDSPRLWSGSVTTGRKKSGQTLQTVAEVLPTKSILKNGTVTPRTDSIRSSVSTASRTVGGAASSASHQDSGSNIVTVHNDLKAAATAHNGSQSRKQKHGSPLLNKFVGLTASARSSLRADKHDETHPAPRMLRLRSKSLSDLNADPDLTPTGSSLPSGCYSDDEDGDDFGFLPFPAARGLTCVSGGPRTAMQKAKGTDGGSSSPSHRLLSRRWRTKGKGSSAPTSPATQPMWSPEVSALHFFLQLCLF